jgi:hypothetical protein
MTVVLIDHRGARFFEAVHTAGGLEERGFLEPKDPHGFLRHLEHRKEADYKGQRGPEADEFYDRIAEHLKGSAPIVLVGDATGKSSAVRYLLDYLKEKRKDVADRVVATEHADLSAITVGEIEAIARRHPDRR